MTQDECIKQAIRRIGRTQYPAAYLLALAVEALQPLTERDKTQMDGKARAEKYDRATFSSTTVEVQLHPPRPVRPYVSNPADVLWLEREIRRRAAL